MNSKKLFPIKPRINLGDSPGRDLKTRVKEHRTCCRNTHEPHALIQHSRETRHTINWNSSKVIFHLDNNIKTRIVESALVKDHDKMNTNPGSSSFGKPLVI